ncbi:MAG: hypothetical protein DRI48_04385 [Chloroflexi bacterium]|nr:MAG: hypothetical protein DRI48_04385 [Chloroflexota bacterium]
MTWAIDLWDLDALLWAFADQETQQETGPVTPVGTGGQRFGLERHLHGFIRDNWESTELAEEWVLYEADGDEEAGFEYPTAVGRIDLLAKHRRRPEWLVVELKRGQSTDRTVAQVLRYMGWVKQHLAEPGETVQGMIISHRTDEAMRYALQGIGTDRVSAMEYKVSFSLRPVPPEEELGSGRAS